MRDTKAEAGHSVIKEGKVPDVPVMAGSIESGPREGETRRRRMDLVRNVIAGVATGSVDESRVGPSSKLEVVVVVDTVVVEEDVVEGGRGNVVVIGVWRVGNDDDEGAVGFKNFAPPSKGRQWSQKVFQRMEREDDVVLVIHLEIRIEESAFYFAIDEKDRVVTDGSSVRSAMLGELRRGHGLL